MNNTSALRQFLKQAKVKPKESLTEQWERQTANAIFYIEKECGGQHITTDYPWMKFISLLEYLVEHLRKEKEEYDRAASKAK